MKTWMISKQHQVGSNRSYAFVHDTGFHPLDIKGKWRSYNKMLAEKWDWDQGVMTTPGKMQDDDNLTLAEIIQNRSQRHKNGRNPYNIMPTTQMVFPEIEGDIVLWRVAL